MNELLRARVRALNKAGELANELYPKLLEVFKSHVGEKVFKKDGGLLAKFEKLLPELPHDTSIRVIRYSSEYSLAWEVTAVESVNGSYGCKYESAMVYVGSVRNGILTDLEEKPPGHRTDFSVHEVLEKRNVCEEKEREYREAKSALFPFGESDR